VRQRAAEGQAGVRGGLLVLYPIGLMVPRRAMAS
jgi:hypothetical protein